MWHDATIGKVVASTQNLFLVRFPTKAAPVCPMKVELRAYCILKGEGKRLVN